MVCSSDLFAAGAQVGQDDVDAVPVDGAHGGCGNAQFHSTVFTGDPEAALVQVGEETAAGFVVGVRCGVAANHALAGALTSPEIGSAACRERVGTCGTSTVCGLL